MYWAYREAARQIVVLNPLPRTPRCVRMWQRARQHFLTDKPSVGAIFVHLVTPSDPDSDGHVGIVTDIGQRTIGAVEGNTNAVGGRLGEAPVIDSRT